MMKIKKLLAVAALAAATTLSYAQAPAAQPDADPAVKAVGEKFRAMYPKTTFSDIRASGIAGLYEVVMGQNIAYTDATGRYFVFGHLFDMKEQVDITAQRQQEKQASRKVKYPAQFLANAIKVVKGDGSRQLVVFSDPNCPYCKKLEQELVKLDNVTIYTFLYPVLGEDSKTLAIATWCASDRARAWSDMMLGQKRPTLISCVTPINDNTVLGTRLGITGTPTLIAADGRLLPGAAPADKINEWLGGVK